MRQSCKEDGGEENKEKSKSWDIRDFIDGAAAATVPGGGVAGIFIFFLPQAVDDAQHLASTGRSVDFFAAETHADLLTGAGFEEPVDEKVAHGQADEDAAVATVFLNGRVVELHEAEPAIENYAHFLRDSKCFVAIARGKRIIVERNIVNNGNKE